MDGGTQAEEELALEKPNHLKFQATMKRALAAGAKFRVTIETDFPGEEEVPDFSVVCQGTTAGFGKDDHPGFLLLSNAWRVGDAVDVADFHDSILTAEKDAKEARAAELAKRKREKELEREGKKYKRHMEAQGGGGGAAALMVAAPTQSFQTAAPSAAPSEATSVPAESMPEPAGQLQLEFHPAPQQAPAAEVRAQPVAASESASLLSRVKKAVNNALQ